MNRARPVRRRLRGAVPLLLDGKALADTTMVMALGVTIDGRKDLLGFVETDTENERALTTFLRSSTLARWATVNSPMERLRALTAREPRA